MKSVGRIDSNVRQTLTPTRDHLPNSPHYTTHCSDKGLTLETSAHNHFQGVKLIHINLKFIHYTFFIPHITGYKLKGEVRI